MRIGQVSKRFGLSIDTIRYYINTGILVPPSVNNQYQFHDKDIEDITWVLKLKKMQYTLSEIHNILSLRRISNWMNNQDIGDYIKLLDEKRIELESKKNEINNSIDLINLEITDYSNMHILNNNEVGIPLRALELLECPMCHKSLSLKNINMNSKHIISGDINCICGYHCQIANGIIHTGSIKTTPYDRPDLDRKLYKTIPSHMISYFQKSYNSMLEKMEKTKNKSAVIMETHINAYFFLYHHFNELSKDNLYIVVDAYPEMLKMYKKRIEQYNNDLDIVYIAANTMDLPIKEKAVDIFIDFFGINEYSIYNKDFMVPHIYRYLKSKGSVIGTYFSFDEGSKSIKRLNELYPDSFELNFNLKKLIDCFYNNSFTNLKIDRIASTKNSGENPAFTFHIDGENLYLDAYRIEKK